MRRCSMDKLADAPAAGFVRIRSPLSFGDLEKLRANHIRAMARWIGTRPRCRIILRAVGPHETGHVCVLRREDFRDGRGFYRNFVAVNHAGFERPVRGFTEAILAA